MSAVRMCDRCGTIFPEGAEGASVGTVTVNERNPRTNRIEPTTKSMDIGPCCGGASAPAPRLSVTGTISPKATLVDGGDEGDAQD